MKFTKKTEIDFTQGNIRHKIIKFVLPLIGAYLIQQLYNSADLVIAGNFIDKSASAAIGAGSLLVTLAIGFFGGLSVGSGIIFSKAFGAHDINAQRRIGQTVLFLSLTVGAALTIAGMFASEPMLNLMNTPDVILKMAVGYIKIYFFSIIPMMLFNMTAGLLRAAGNSGIPMIFQTVSGGINILLDILFVRTFSSGVQGVAAATVISQAIAAVGTYIYFVISEKNHYDLHIKDGDFNNYKPIDESIVPIKNTAIMKVIFSLGVPVGIQNMIVTLSNIFVQTNINSLGVDAIAAFTAYYKIELFMYYPIMSFGQAALFIVGQNLGAAKKGRIKPAVKSVITTALPILIVIETLVFIFANPMFRIFNPESEVIRLGTILMRTTTPFYWIYVILEVLSNSIRSFGKTKAAMFITLINFAASRVVLLASFSTAGILSVRTVGSIYPLTWFSAALCFWIFWRRLTKEKYE